MKNTTIECFAWTAMPAVKRGKIVLAIIRSIGYFRMAPTVLCVLLEQTMYHFSTYVTSHSYSNVHVVLQVRYSTS